MARHGMVRGGKASRIEHPEGGVFFIRPLPTKELLRYRESLKDKGVDVKGDESTGVEVAVRSDVDTSQELIDFVKGYVESVSDFVDDATQEEIPSTPEFIDEVLWLNLPAEDGKRQLVALWVFTKAIEVANGRKADEVKN